MKVREVNIVSAVWGERYWEMFYKVMIPTLYTSTNILGILPYYSIKHTVYVQPGQDHQLNQFHDIASSNNWPVTITHKPEIEGDTPGLLSLTNIMLKHNQECLDTNSIIVYSTPDLLYGHGLAGIVTSMPEHGYVVTNQVRIDLSKLDLILNFLSTTGYKKSLDNSDYVRFFMEVVPHPCVTHGLNTYKDMPSSDDMVHEHSSLQLWYYGREPSYYKAHLRTPHPIAHAPSETIVNMISDRAKSYFSGTEAIDHEIVWALEPKGLVRRISDTREFIVGEMTDPEKFNPTICNSDWTPTCKRYHDIPVIMWR